METPEHFEDNLQSRIDIEFEAYVSVQLTGTKRELEKLADKKILPQKECDAILEAERKRFQEMGPDERMATIVNNFHFWFPGGYYRQIAQDQKIHQEAGQDEILAKEKLMRDLDELISSRGYGHLAHSIAKQEGNKETRLKIMAELYFKMRDRGYDRTQFVS